MDVNRYFINKLTDDICQYIDWLQEAFGYQISLHGVERTSCSKWYRFLKYYYHQCALCLEVKRSADAWQHCIDRQQIMRQRMGKEPLLGTCYAGVTEYVFPLLDIHGESPSSQEKVGFLCVSGYTLHREEAMERAMAAAERYNLPRSEMAYAVACLKNQLPEREVITRQIAPVQDMFAMLFHFCDLLYLTDENSSPQQALFMKMIRTLNGNYRNPDYSLKKLCSQLIVSYTYASHVFSRFSDVPFRRYLRRLRVETAKKYLEHSQVSISLIAIESGFEDSNYFSSTFRAETGVTPSEWRSEHAIAYPPPARAGDRPLSGGTTLPPH